MKHLIRFVPCAAYALALALTGYSARPSLGQDAKPHLVTIHSDIGYAAAFRELGRLADVQIQVDPDLTRATPLWFVPQHVRLDESKLPFETALEDLIDRSGTPLKFSVVNGVYVVDRDLTRPVRPVPQAVNVALYQHLNDAISTILQSAGLNGFAWDPNLVKDRFPLRANGLILYKLDDSAVKAKVDLGQFVQIQRVNTSYDDVLKDLLASAQPSLTYNYEQDPNNGQPLLRIKLDPNTKPLPNAPTLAPPTETGSHNCRNAPFDQALANLFRGEGKYRIDPGVTISDEPVTFSTENVSFETTLTTLLGSVKSVTPLTYQVENGVYVILPGETAHPVRDQAAAGSTAPDIVGARRITLMLKGATLQDALKILFAQVDGSYIYAEPKAPKGDITLTLQNIPLKSAITSLLRSLDTDPGLFYESRDGIVMLGPKSDVFPRPDTSQLNIVAHFHDASLYDALKALFLWYNGQFTLDPELRNARVNGTISGKSLPEAVKLLLRNSTRPYDMRVENEVYSFVSK